MKYIIYFFDQYKHPLHTRMGNESVEISNLQYKICDDDYLFELVHYVNAKAKWWKNMGPELDDMEHVQKGKFNYVFTILHSSFLVCLGYHTILLFSLDTRMWEFPSF